jgi:hypothetical protein
MNKLPPMTTKTTLSPSESNYNRQILPPIPPINRFKKKNKYTLIRSISLPSISLTPILPNQITPNAFEREIDPSKLVENERYTFYENNAVVRGTFVHYLSENGMMGLRIKIDKYSTNNRPETGDMSTPLYFIKKITNYKIGPNADLGHYINQFI